MKKIIIVESKSPGAHVFSRVQIPRLGAILLGTILRDKGYDIKVYVEDIAPIDMKEVMSADYVCISTITSTAIAAYELADKVRAAGIPVIMGGAHVSFLPEEALEHCDYVIRGEGEYALVELLDALDNSKPIDQIKGLSYISDDKVVNIERADYECDLDKFPTPDYSLIQGISKKTPILSMSTSRGCPFGCKFCSVIHMFGRKIRQNSIDRVISDIKQIAPRCKHIFFCDDNFTMNKERTKQLLRRVIDEGLKIQWSAQVRVDVANDDELLDLMKRSGCYMVFIGFESINPDTLKDFHKGQDLDDIKKAIRRLHEYKIFIHGMFVFGSDYDDIQTLRDTNVFAKTAGIDSVQYLMLTPLPGTPLYNEFKEDGRIFNHDWSKYDAHHVVFEPKKMSSYELQIETIKAMKSFYTYGSMIKYMFLCNWFYTYLTYYSRRLAANGLKNNQNYINYIKDFIKNKFFIDFKKEEVSKEKKLIAVGISNPFIDENYNKFFSTFLEKLGYKVIKDVKIDSEEISETEVLTFLERCKTQIDNLSHRVDCIVIPNAKELAERLKGQTHKFDEAIKIFVAESQQKIISFEISETDLYKMCIELGLTLDENIKEIRKAYNQAIKQFNYLELKQV